MLCTNFVLYCVRLQPGVHLERDTEAIIAFGILLNASRSRFIYVSCLTLLFANVNVKKEANTISNSRHRRKDRLTPEIAAIIRKR